MSSIIRPPTLRKLRPWRSQRQPSRSSESHRISDGDHICPTCNDDESPNRWAPASARRCESPPDPYPIVADDSRGMTRPVGKLHSDFTRPVHDMAVGDDESVGRDDESRPAASRLAGLAVGRVTLFLHHSMLTTLGLTSRTTFVTAREYASRSSVSSTGVTTFAVSIQLRYRLKSDQ